MNLDLFIDDTSVRIDSLLIVIDTQYVAVQYLRTRPSGEFRLQVTTSNATNRMQTTAASAPGIGTIGPGGGPRGRLS